MKRRTPLRRVCSLNRIIKYDTSPQGTELTMKELNEVRAEFGRRAIGA